MLKVSTLARPQPRVATAVEIGVVTAQWGLALALVARFHLLDYGFLYVGALALAALPLNAFMPRAWRPWLFLGISLASVPLALGWVAGAWLVAVGTLLCGLCHLPLPKWARYALLAAVIAILAGFRGQWWTPPAPPAAAGPAVADAALELDNAAADAPPAPATQPPWWPPVAIWPVVGAMFMLRLVIYLHDLEHSTQPVQWPLRLAYFFMLPNVVCMLFPLVDFRTFERNYYGDADESSIYQRGAQWVQRGVVHLVLYKLVYQFLVIDCTDVHTLGDLLQYIYTPFLLYLRVSGEFHIYAGMLRLFGFGLPETHHEYFLSSSFTDFWRRTNIYWKDFMLKVFYYPAYFRLRQWGTTTALVLATCFVFVVTWTLHAYLHFWILGDFLWKANDILFWTILGVAVVINTLWEVRFPQRRTLGAVRRTPAQALVVGLKTLATFSLISLLWSLWSEESLEIWLNAWNVLGDRAWGDPATLVGWLLGAAGFVALAIWRSARTPTERLPFWPSAGTVLAVLLFLGLCSFEPVVKVAGHTLGWASPRAGQLVFDAVRSLRRESHNKRDYTRLQRGYYENLAAVGAHNPELARLYRARPADFIPFMHDRKLTRQVQGVPSVELIPEVRVQRDGVTYSVNRWGMRDRQYEQSKPPRTVRVALLGASQPMGVGVSDDDTYEAIVERQLNEAADRDGTVRWELLNFAVAGYTLMEYPAVLERRALPFQPDAVIYVAHSVETWRVLSHLADAVHKKLPLPYDDLGGIIADSRLEKSTSANDAYRRLGPFQDRILDWGNGRIMRTCRDHQLVPFWINVPFPIAMDDEQDVEPLKQRALAAGFEVIDLADVYQGSDPQSLCVSAWDHHPGPQGHALIAKRLFEIFSTDPRFQQLAERAASQQP